MIVENKIDYQANQWLIKENKGLNEHEKAELTIWLENEENQKAYNESKKIITECLDLDEEFIKEIEQEALSKTSVNNIFYNNKFIAACVVTISIITLAVFEIYSSFQPVFSQNYISKNEKILNITLPDNSVIDLDLKSQVKVNYYKDKREIDFTNGVAFFNIAKDKTKPFTIRAGNTLIKVIGTRFEVINLGKYTTINVDEGLVQVDYLNETNNRSKPIEFLTGLETLTLNKQGKIIKHNKINQDHIASWKKDIIEFNKTTLQEAFDLFTQYSTQKVEFETHELSLLKVSGKFSTLHYNSFLESIELIYPLRILKERNTIKVMNK